VDRPEVDDWKTRWGSESWWKDNFVRNNMMVTAAEQYVICGAVHPNTIIEDTKISGGTAACVRSMVSAGIKRAIYVPSETPSDIVWVNF